MFCYLIEQSHLDDQAQMVAFSLKVVERITAAENCEVKGTVTT